MALPNKCGNIYWSIVCSVDELNWLEHWLEWWERERETEGKGGPLVLLTLLKSKQSQAEHIQIQSQALASQNSLNQLTFYMGESEIESRMYAHAHTSNVESHDSISDGQNIIRSRSLSTGGVCWTARNEFYIYASHLYEKRCIYILPIIGHIYPSINNRVGRQFGYNETIGCDTIRYGVKSSPSLSLCVCFR